MDWSDWLGITYMKFNISFWWLSCKFFKIFQTLNFCWESKIYFFKLCSELKRKYLPHDGIYREELSAYLRVICLFTSMYLKCIMFDKKSERFKITYRHEARDIIPYLFRLTFLVSYRLSESLACSNDIPSSAVRFGIGQSADCGAINGSVTGKVLPYLYNLCFYGIQC